ncbi:hypothetical protein TWF106_000169 [Orbilia oligospora]|uniref:Nucleoside phosphorylase domain-containing protein n=1 Tax=Orbilia oligospora TaxID=2813651 RepID=A0A7C8R4Z9_ORBOL|nr:hypothetical protein TWF106_000066 [Orbilia oligospora]KAF3229781.1 hypothetical protein TWF106_000169 [Orbilia oligospora]KAF3230082.1 hypothetical protein TWF191_000322 [Orbilia oligospora]
MDYINECYDNTFLCFEMEAAGLVNTFPCLVVRGIGDYADSHKNDGWRNRAIAAASVYAKALITIIRPEDVVELPKSGRKCGKGLRALDWITSIDYDSQLSDIIKKSQEGTGRWLLYSPEYQNWANGGNLLKQFAGRCSPLPSEVKQLYITHYSRKTRRREAEIVIMLRAITKLFTKSFTIVDKLDECQKVGGYKTKFLNVLFDIQKEVGISILATSRSDGDISRFFEGAVALQISASRDDVKAYLADRMGRLEPEILDDEVRSMAESAISEAADGMFLLTTLYVNMLEAQLTKRHLKMALRDFKKREKGLTATYIEAIEWIKRQSEPIIALSKRCLGWIIHTGRLLSPDELRHALAVFPSDKNLDRDSMP